MTPGKLDLLLYRGDSYHWQFTLWDDVAKTEPSDLTGVTVKAEIRDKAAGALLVVLTCTVQPPNVIVMDLDAGNSALLTSFGGVWDLQLTYPTGDVSTVLAGAVKVTLDVTDSAAATVGLRRVAG